MYGRLGGRRDDGACMAAMKKWIARRMEDVWLDGRNLYDWVDWV
jgi:hypothetical protein